MSEFTTELNAVLALMEEYEVDHVELPNGLKVTKSRHAHRAPAETEHRELAPGEEDWDKPAPERPMQNGVAPGRIPVDYDEILFAASDAPEIPLTAFGPQVPPIPTEGETE